MTLKAHQEMVISDLHEKVAFAPQEASDEFMYQDRQEAERELIAAQQVLNTAPVTPEADAAREQVWNPLPYHRYRGQDD